jgi:ribosome biogenesis GTPase
MSAHSGRDADEKGFAGRKFERPSKRNTRPRTKTRPEHLDAQIGMVVAVDRGRYQVLLDKLEVVAMKARELSRSRIVVGDQVGVVGDTPGSVDALARIDRIEPRTSVLRRTADDNDPYERVIVANADQLMVVVACANPEPRIGMIDRAVVAAYEAGMNATLILTKADLASPEPLLRLFEPAGVRVIVSRPQLAITKQGQADSIHPDDDEPELVKTLALDEVAVAEVRAALEGKVSVFLGHSGVGKSTLVNALAPAAARITGAVNQVTGRGRQTTTSVLAVPLPDNSGWVIDTPGIRSLGIAHAETEHVLAAFSDLETVAAAQCPRGCSHLASAPDCALDEWVAAVPALAETRQLRVDSLRRLLATRAEAATDLLNHASMLTRRSAAG